MQGSSYVALYNNADGALYLQSYFGQQSVPLGGMIDYIGSTSPYSNFVIPIGQAISRTAFASLFALISTTYGAGDGSQTFNLPNLSGRVTAMLDSSGTVLTSATMSPNGNTLGATGGAAKISLAAGNIPPHTHSGTTGADSPDHAHAYTGLTGNTTTGGGAFPAREQHPALETGGASARHAHAFTTDRRWLAGTAFSLLQPTLLVNKLLRII